jgi:hypothetical protein
MSEPEGFLARWSRRKHTTQTPAAPEADATPTADAPSVAAPASGETAPSAPTGELPDFDLSKLPAIESITSATDIRPFLAPGVPAELTRAALRRAWTTDPAIRDFIGIAENQWDFTAPDGVPGFGVLPDGEQVRRLLARVTGEAEPEAAAKAVPEAPSQVAEAETGPDAPFEEDSHSPVAEQDVVQCSKVERATQEQPSEGPQARPRHGSALPQ